MHLLVEHGRSEEQSHFIICRTSTGTGETSLGNVTGESAWSFIVLPKWIGLAAGVEFYRDDFQSLSDNAHDVHAQ